MKYQIKDFAKLTNVSVRTLHYYDGIGLLKPAFVDKQNSYRFYDEKSLERMQEILFYRELDFTLKEISNILSAENYNKSQALNKQKQLLLLKKKHIERLISAIDCIYNRKFTFICITENGSFFAVCSVADLISRYRWFISSV